MSILEEMLIDTDFTLLNLFEELNELIATKDQNHRSIVNENQLLEGEITLLENELCQQKLQYWSYLNLLNIPNNATSKTNLRTEKFQLENELKVVNEEIENQTENVDQLKMELKKSFVALRVAQKQFANEIESHQNVLNQCSQLKLELDVLQNQPEEEEKEEGEEEEVAEVSPTLLQLRSEVQSTEMQKKILQQELDALRAELDQQNNQ